MGITKNEKVRWGFTLIEVLIVVMILAILATRIAVLHQMSGDEAALTAMQVSEAQLQRAISVYGVDHGGKKPVISERSLPQLTSHSNAAGEIGAADIEHPFGPYIVEIPVNPISKTDVVTVTFSAKPKLTNFAGWIYNPNTGIIRGGTKRQAGFAGY